jgi:cyclic pyranopterin phosphate synthase
MLSADADPVWAACRFLTCSVLPVRFACDLGCRFCFSKSSISALRHERTDWRALDLEAYFRFARERGATRLVVTGGGEPLLRPDDVVEVIERGRAFFDEIACFTNGTRLTPALARRLDDAGLSYLCWSRHHGDDAANRALMGEGAPALADFFARAGGLRVRATCVMARGFVEGTADAWRYVEALAPFGVREFTFKHTYVSYEASVFRDAAEDHWARRHQVELDPFEGQGEVVGTLPWGPAIRRIGGLQVCGYREPTPAWEREHRLCRSSNLLSDGKVYASLEDERSRLFTLTCSPPRSPVPKTSSGSGRSSRSDTPPGSRPTGAPPRS